MLIPSAPHTLLNGLVSRIMEASSRHRGEEGRRSPRMGLLDWARSPTVLGRGMAPAWSVRGDEIPVGLHSAGVGTLQTQTTKRNS